MYRIRFHGRGGQGLKTASRILGHAFFVAGFEVQDAPRYGAERRGAPIFAYVRAARAPIRERGIIRNPDLVIVADDTVVAIPSAAVLQGLDPHSVLLIASREPADVWQQRLNLAGPIVVLGVLGQVEDRATPPLVGTACASAAARMVGVIEDDALATAVAGELAPLGAPLVDKNRQQALEAYHAMAAHAGCVKEGTEIRAQAYERPDWIELAFEDVRRSAPTVHAAATAREVKTGLWRTLRPVIDYERCNRCWWVCSTFCPDGAITVSPDRWPEIDYDHCKGCLICVAQCPPHAIETVPEHVAHAEERAAT